MFVGLVLFFLFLLLFCVVIVISDVRVEKSLFIVSLSAGRKESKMGDSSRFCHYCVETRPQKGRTDKRNYTTSPIGDIRWNFYKTLAVNFPSLLKASLILNRINEYLQQLKRIHSSGDVKRGNITKHRILHKDPDFIIPFWRNSLTTANSKPRRRFTPKD